MEASEQIERESLAISLPTVENRTLIHNFNHENENCKTDVVSNQKITSPAYINQT